MKIVAADVFVTCPGRNFVTLKITTDEGIIGLGDATLNGRELSVASYLKDHLCPQCADPRRDDSLLCVVEGPLDVFAVEQTGYLSDAGPKIKAFFRERGVLLRPLGNVIYLMPPYCVTPLDLDLAYDAIHAAADMIETAAR